MEEKFLIAPKGQVYTCYKQGDAQIVYGSKISYRTQEPPTGWYLMDEEEAKQIEEKLKPEDVEIIPEIEENKEDF